MGCLKIFLSKGAKPQGGGGATGLHPPWFEGLMTQYGIYCTKTESLHTLFSPEFVRYTGQYSEHSRTGGEGGTELLQPPPLRTQRV